MGSETKTLMISIFAGIIASFLIYSYSQEKKAELDRTQKKKLLVVASRDITELDTINDSMLEIRDFPEEYAGPTHVTQISDAVGKIAAAPFKKGEQILLNKLLTPGPDTGISFQVAPGKRAITLPVDEIRGVAKLIKPGDRIDIMAAVDVGKGPATRREVSVLMQDVPVLATGTNVVNNIPRSFELEGGKPVQINFGSDTKFNSVTIETDPKLAQDLIFILSTQPSNLYFTLRNPNDRGHVRIPAATIESVINRPIPSSFDAGSVPGTMPGLQPGGPAKTGPSR